MSTNAMSITLSQNVLADIALDSVALVQSLGLPLDEAMASKVRGRAVAILSDINMKLPPALQCGNSRCGWSM